MTQNDKPQIIKLLPKLTVEFHIKIGTFTQCYSRLKTQVYDNKR